MPTTNDFNPWDNSVKTESSQQNLQWNQPIVSAKKNVFDFQIKRVLQIWPWMIVSSIVFFSTGWLFLRYSINVYEARMSVVLENNSEVSLGQALFSTRDPLNNQIALLRSQAVSQRVVDKFNLQNHAVLIGQVKDKELFDEFKWVVTIPAKNKKDLNFEVYPFKTGFSWQSGNIKGKGKWGEVVMIRGNEIRVYANENFSKDAVIKCYDENPDLTAEILSQSINVGTSKESNVIELSLRDPIPERAVAILNEIINAYNKEALITKSKTYQQSYAFIQERLTPVTFELDSIETAMANYKAQKGFIGNSTKGSIYLNQSIGYEDKLKEIQLQKAMLNAAETYLKDKSAKDVYLATPGISDQGIQIIIGQFHQLRAEREKLAQSLTESNPRLQKLDEKIQEARNNIDLQLENYRSNIRLLENFIKTNMEASKNLLSSSPADEKAIMEQSRLQNIKQSLFLLLLQKREEAAINLAGVSIQTSILSSPKIPNIPVSPKRSEILIGSFLLGLILPLGFAGLKEVLNNKIQSKNQLQQMIGAPVLAEIDHATKIGDNELVVKNKDRSVFGEQIRGLRTNLNFYVAGKKPFYIMLTSSMSGEGKSFVAANLAASFALLGKKTAILEFDLRKPKLNERFGLKKGLGIVNILLGELNPDQVAVKVLDEYPLFLYPTGPIPPNPSELLESDNMNKLKLHLDRNYEVVIIDTPPYALVSDAQILAKWSDVNLFVVRFGKTLREQIHEMEEARLKNQFKNMVVILNGISMSGYYGYKYGYYGAKRKYGYNYYERS